MFSGGLSWADDCIDMVLSVNGIPVVALELKNRYKKQTYRDAIKQYKKDRSSKEFCFRLDHRFLVYFTVDLSKYRQSLIYEYVTGKRISETVR